jgi:feruloyl-CoA synthase
LSQFAKTNHDAPSPHAGVVYRSIKFGSTDVHCETTSNGIHRIRSKEALRDYEPNLARLFRHAVEAEPGGTFIAERVGEPWKKISYEQARPKVDAIAASLIERGLSTDRPVTVLSGNSIDHALLMLACFTAGVPVAPISVAYSLQSQDHNKLKFIANLITPGMIYVADTEPYATALAAIDLDSIEIVASKNGANLENITFFDSLFAAKPSTIVEQSIAAIKSETIAKFLFTSGSTGMPKAVINTHGMLTANQQQLSQVWPFIKEQPLTLLDWLPWSHTFAGNHDFNAVLKNAGTLYLDAGKPLPALIRETVRNIADISPSIYLSVPSGYSALLPFLEHDETLARKFFANLRLIFYAGASLSQDLWERLETLSVRTIGERVPMASSWGTTETAPLALAAQELADRAGVIGTPAPALEVKLVPSGNKLEVRVRGPNITPGYWKRPDLTQAAFDEEGYYKPGDAVRFVDSNDPSKGFFFDGRLAEDFKLTTGTWVACGTLRISLLATASPMLQDAIVAGHDRDFVAILAWLNAAGCQALIGEGAPANLLELARHPKVREYVCSAIIRHNAIQTGTSQRIERVILLSDMPSIDGGEITDKGYINQRTALERRFSDVERLFAEKPDADVIVTGKT